MKIILLLIGLCLLGIEHRIAFTAQLQFIFFITGILFIGIPHGAADLLVETENSVNDQSFSPGKFHVKYLARIGTFALMFWFFPVLANFLFVLIAAYHFGETDLISFKNDHPAGKFFTLMYGLLILAVIILPHFNILKPLCNLFYSGRNNNTLIQYIDQHWKMLLCIIGGLFFISFLWQVALDPNGLKKSGSFFIEYLLLLGILFFLPMILGFTFYFVLWHSLFSLRNILKYLNHNGLIPVRSILKQIGIFSLLSFTGFLIFGFAGLFFLKQDSLVAYVFLSLAVLTAPHMQVMHKMYNQLKILPGTHATGSRLKTSQVP